MAGSSKPRAGKLDTALFTTEMRLQTAFCAALREYAPRAWVDLVSIRTSGDLDGAERWAELYGLTADWILPQVWYEAELAIQHPELFPTAAAALAPVPRTTFARDFPEPSPEVQSRAEYVALMGRLAAAAYDHVATLKRAKGRVRVETAPSNHLEWLIRHQVLREPYHKIWAHSKLRSASAVRQAVIKLAKRLKLQLRPETTGRPHRKTPSKKS